MPRVIRTDRGEPLLTGTSTGATPDALLENRTALTKATGPAFFCIEIDAFVADAAVPTLPLSYNTLPHNVLSFSPPSFGSVVTIRASDFGYRTRADDPGGVQVYPAVLSQAIQIDREVPLDLAQTSAGGSWGELCSPTTHRQSWRQR